MAARQFQVVETPDEDETPAKPVRSQREPDNGIAAQALVLGLTALSQRAIAGGKALFTLLSLAAAWWLWLKTPQPDVFQIASLSIFAAFILAMNWIVWKK